MADELRPEEQEKAAQEPSTFQEIMQHLVAESMSRDEDEDDVEKEDDQSPVVRMANAILVTAIESGASDMYIEPERKLVNVRVRVDGVVQPLLQFPKHVQRAIEDRYKVMTDIPLDERHSPHQGSIPIRHGGDDYDLRVSVVPSLHGDNFVFRIL